jgi:IS605 OrfB family transposase
MPIIIRTEAHALVTTPAIRDDVERTVAFFRRVVRMSATVAMTHWPELGSLRTKERQMALEALLHPTKLRPTVRYAVLGQALGKMPSYLRRAALNAALGVVSSFMSNYNNWLDGEIGGKNRELGSRTPTIGLSNVFPSLYGGNMILLGTRELPVKKLQAKDMADFVGPQRKPLTAAQVAAGAVKTIITPHGFVRIKLIGQDGQWFFSQPLKIHGKMKRLDDIGRMDLSPTLMIRGAKTWLSCPVEIKTPTYKTNSSLVKQAAPFRVCSIDVGINTAATLAIVDSTGTVIARKFLTYGRHNDQRDNLGLLIAEKQNQSGGSKRGQAFCSNLHRRIAGLSLDAARHMARGITAFALQNGASLFVIEDLKGWRPKGKGQQKKRFHRFQHRMLIQYLGHKAQELGMRVLEVYARGTSRYAYDGSGKVKRSTTNAQLATFSSGKQYNADLNGALNIAARGLAMVMGIKGQEKLPGTDAGLKTESNPGKSSGSEVRMPLVLADIWTHAKSIRPALCENNNRNHMWVSQQESCLLCTDAPGTVA